MKISEKQIQKLMEICRGYAMDLPNDSDGYFAIMALLREILQQQSDELREVE